MFDKRRVKCYYLNCANNKFNSPTTAMFKVPEESERCKLWLTYMGRLDLMGKSPSSLHQNVRVCADHFEEKHFTSTLRTRLQRFAEPIPIRAASPEITVLGTTKGHRDFVPEENAESQGQSSDEHTEEQDQSVNSHANTSSGSTVPSSNMGSKTSKSSGTIKRNSQTQKSACCCQSIGNLDAVDHLFLSWAKTVKTFSPNRLTETKTAIANIILKWEEEEMQALSISSNS